MNSPLHTVVRAGLIGSAAIVVTALTGLPATAASAPLEYSCEYWLPGVDDFDLATASFDTGVGSDVVVDVGDDVSLDPVTGSITLPSGFVDALRDAGTTEIAGDVYASIILLESDSGTYGEMSYEATPVPDAGPMTLQVDGTGGEIRATDPGTQTLVLVDFSVTVGPPVDEEEESVGMFCDLTDEGDATLDSFEVLPPVTPTTTVTTTATVTGPVVETDRPSTGSGGTLLASTGAAAMLAGVGALLLGRRRQGNHR